MEFDLDEQEGALDISTEGNIIVCDGAEVQEPYDLLCVLCNAGVQRLMGELLHVDLDVTSRGFLLIYGTIGPDKKPRSCAREGCKATILVKLEKSGKWVVSRFVKEHNHPLVMTEQGLSICGDKDKKIEQLTRELRRQDQLCAAYREILQRFLISIEEQADQLSSKIQDIVENVRKVEAEAQTTLPK
ncbi:far-red impaired responsive (FAR1) family protein [Actinidia rufa]|uniref:Far-red impaired responsive (FAR1) family protein n=1 Tax=Actinidia rufa TaxID=165716 RepID=A0A7J0HAR7_9ERIC|nr:far-red impaired responsive (FAR1) family protein [Actinidia rufa]